MKSRRMAEKALTAVVHEAYVAGLNPLCRRAGPRDGHERHLKELGLAAVRGDRQQGEGVPRVRQRCRAHYMRSALAYAGKSGWFVVSAFITTAFRPGRCAGRMKPMAQVANRLRPKLPKLACFLDDAETDVPVYTARSSCGIFCHRPSRRRDPARSDNEWAVQRGRCMTLETIAVE